MKSGKPAAGGWISAALGAAFLASPLFALDSATSGNWDDGATWAGGLPPGAGDDVVITGACTVTLTGTLERVARNLTVQAGGQLTHAGHSTLDTEARHKLRVTVLQDLTVEAGGSIHADGKGFAQLKGPGPARHGSGAGHGGVGGSRNRPAGGGTTYGSVIAPVDLGSGGNYLGQYGGGAVILTVGGTTFLQGFLSANGTNDTTINPNPYYGPSGGSVFLTTGALSGNGAITANSAWLQSNGDSYGGGGRVAVILTNSASFDAVRMEAVSSTSTNAKSAPNWGAAGTVYREHTGHAPGQGQLTVDYQNRIPADPTVSVTLQNGLAASSNGFSEIILTNGGAYALDADDILSVPAIGAIRGDPTNAADGLWIGGVLHVETPFNRYSNFFVGISAPGASFRPTPNLLIGSGEVFRVNAPFVLDVGLTLEPGSLVEHSRNNETELYMVDVTVNGDLLVQTGATINADGLGYVATKGPGRSISGNAGGAHGGVGGGRTTGQGGLFIYGSLTAPTNIGSGGSYGGPPGSDGGGAIKLNVRGTTTLFGSITANAREAYYSGAGGSVFLTTGGLAGDGRISANSSTSYSWGLGGGGRVAVILTNQDDFAAVTTEAKPAITTSSPITSGGGAGTVYLQTRGQGPGQGTLIVDGASRSTTSATILSSNVSDLAVGAVVIRNGATLELSTNQTLSVRGSWSNGAVFVAREGSTVAFTGTASADLVGSHLFVNLTAGDDGKTIRFEAGSTTTVQRTLTLLPGTTLRSASDGSPWWLILEEAGGTQQIGRVAVKDSQAGLGQTLRAPRGSVNLGNNANWLFPGTGALILVK